MFTRSKGPDFSTFREGYFAKKTQHFNKKYIHVFSANLFLRGI